MRRALGTVGGRALAGLLVLVVAYQVWIGITATTKVDDDVGRDRSQEGHFAIDVVLGFVPERFHMLQLQDHGRIGGRTDNVLHMHRVTDEDVDAIARKYWVEEIRAGETFSPFD
ncbi:hypothetical protein EF847_20285 [Actinobacteria bacterium YIM 96077]|uniref:Uncharacterized protein n=1 Tax=Phytoactinopolyspora halophila TaxID=1981511 RepID=A0A329QGV9_9ACTN|nr:hypothetical protein [Phytoactinopolyspora halophila]AYY14682.1 hypothetical protein EF847_20285 [Actinobacteria bacterium YIM 96077]RAW11607.1 hypothetical protein DPM12_16165 [Phytoactinopolyspora halophila]